MSLALEAVSIWVQDRRTGERPLIRDLTLSVPAGGVVTLMGPSGVGKSSLLAYASGALPAGLRGAGRVLVDGADVTHLAPHRRSIGILFQDDLLFPHMSVGDNLAFGLSPALRGRDARRAAVQRALEEAELPGVETRDPSTLSGGQRARVALMRVLLSAPRALLLDEPFSRLDRALRGRFRDLVLAAARARQLPVLLVTHEWEDGSGSVIELASSEGKGP